MPYYEEPDMPNIAHFLYKNLILKIVRLWEHGHFVGILGLENRLNGKVIFELCFFLSLSFFFFLIYIIILIKYRERIIYNRKN
jgi:hypothetical protein